MERPPDSCKDDSQVVAKLADFGLATYCDPTTKGLKGIAGTDIYMAPEIVRQYENTDIPQQYRS